MSGVPDSDYEIKQNVSESEVIKFLRDSNPSEIRLYTNITETGPRITLIHASKYLNAMGGIHWNYRVYVTFDDPERIPQSTYFRMRQLSKTNKTLFDQIANHWESRRRVSVVLTRMIRMTKVHVSFFYR